MYLLPIQVPIYLDGSRLFLTSEWLRSLILLRDSFSGRFGDITVAAPTLPVASVDSQTLVEFKSEAGIRLVPSFDRRCRARQYWMRQRAKWKADLAPLIEQADVVHAGLDDVYRPIAFDGFRAAVAAGKPTVFVQDTDIVAQQTTLAKDYGIAGRAKLAVYVRIYEKLCRDGVAQADLSLLKGRTLMDRYGRFAKNACEFHDTSFSVADIVSEADLESRLVSLKESRPIRFVYCGRLLPRKGVDRSIHLISEKSTLDIIGDGPERSRLETIGNPRVKFLGALPYGPDLIKKLATYDALLFTPTAEDTPRMIFDGYAAGLPLVASDIPYVRERSASEHAAILLPDSNAKQIFDSMLSNPSQLIPLARAARTAADYHAAENWYKRRAEWTIQAVEARRKA